MFCFAVCSSVRTTKLTIVARISPRARLKRLYIAVFDSESSPTLVTPTSRSTKDFASITPLTEHNKSYISRQSRHSHGSMTAKSSRISIPSARSPQMLHVTGSLFLSFIHTRMHRLAKTITTKKQRQNKNSTQQIPDNVVSN